MKYIKVVIETMLAVPDHTEVLNHPQDELECLKIGDQYYMPTVEWSRDERDGTWGDADEAFDKLLGEGGTEEASIQTIPEEEFRRAAGEEEDADQG